MLPSSSLYWQPPRVEECLMASCTGLIAGSLGSEGAWNIKPPPNPQPMSPSSPFMSSVEGRSFPSQPNVWGPTSSVDSVGVRDRLRRAGESRRHVVSRRQLRTSDPGSGHPKWHIQLDQPSASWTVKNFDDLSRSVMVSGFATACNHSCFILASVGLLYFCNRLKRPTNPYR